MPSASSAPARRRAPTIRMLPIDRLVPTADNTRRRITRESIESLAKSIAREGMLQPIVVRPHPEEQNRWEIRAGERRWRAAKLAGLQAIPAIIRPLDDTAARAVTIAENLQRENLHPLEEGAAFQQALDTGAEPKQLAARLGKAVGFVLRRASLTRLTSAWREAVLTADTEPSRLSAAHLELIARLPSETQDLLAENMFERVLGHGLPSVGQLRAIIDEGLRSLVSMPWKLDDETLAPTAGPCSVCPKRSGMQPSLFDDGDAPQNGRVSKTDRCLDPVCFANKLAAHVQRCEATARQKHPELAIAQIGPEPLDEPVRAVFGDRVERLYHPRIVKASAKGARAVLQVSGPKAGSVVFVQDERSPASLNGHHAVKKGGPLTDVERRARFRRRRDTMLVNRLGALLGEYDEAKCRQAIASGSPPSSKLGPLVLAFGTTFRFDRPGTGDPWTIYESACQAEHETLSALALHDLVRLWLRRLANPDRRTVDTQAIDARRFAGLLAIDLAPIEAEIERLIPTPKSWPPETTGESAESPPFESEPTPQTKAERRSGKKKRFARNARTRKR